MNDPRIADPLDVQEKSSWYRGYEYGRHTGPIVVKAPGLLQAFLVGFLGAVVGVTFALLVFAKTVEAAAPRQGVEEPLPQRLSGASHTVRIETGRLSSSASSVDLGIAARRDSGAPPSPSPTPRKTAAVSSGGEPTAERRVTGSVHPRLGRDGTLSHMGDDYPANYLAIPIGPGHRIKLCAAICREYVSTDAGPNKEMLDQGRIADASVQIFEAVCQCSARRGLYRGASWRLVG